jgi:hypothetical protein
MALEDAARSRMRSVVNISPALLTSHNFDVNASRIQETSLRICAAFPGPIALAFASIQSEAVITRSTEPIRAAVAGRRRRRQSCSESRTLGSFASVTAVCSGGGARSPRSGEQSTESTTSHRRLRACAPPTMHHRQRTRCRFEGPSRLLVFFVGERSH